MTTQTHQTQAEGPTRTACTDASAKLVAWQDYRASRTDWFRTPDAFRWYQRQHQAELTKAGALAVIAGRVFVVPQVFDDCVITIGQRLAQQRAA